jgi:hypothetical protein
MPSSTRLITAPYPEQLERWPKRGKHIMAQYDDATVVVYQAYRPGIGHYAAEHGAFGGEFSFQRMSWIKPNFLWMMYRCGWATKQDQEVVLAIRLRREAFDTILEAAVNSTFKEQQHASEADWKRAVQQSEVRLQWDPDHDPSGHRVERRAIQLGLRGETLRRYGGEWLVEIEDVSGFVRKQHAHVVMGDLAALWTPSERPYPASEEVRRRLGMD